MNSKIQRSSLNRLLAIISFCIILCNGLSAQSLKKTFKYIEVGDIDRAILEVNQFTDKVKESGVDFKLYGLASCLIVCNEKHPTYDPYKALEMFEITSNINADKAEVNEFLVKYTFSIDKVQEIINQSIFNQAKSINTEESFKKALSVCNKCFYEQEVIKLKEDAAYVEAKNTRSVMAFKHFIDSYKDSKYKDEMIRELEKLGFEEAKIQMSIASMNNYLENYPRKGNNYLLIATHLRDSIAFSNIQKTYLDYLNYSYYYPKSEYNNIITKELPNLLYKQALKEKDIKLLDLFINKYPNDSRVEETKKVSEELHYENLKSEVSLAGFDDFKTMFPNSNHIEELSQIYGRLTENKVDGNKSNSSNIVSNETVKDIDGNLYKTVTIGNQVWMQENLKTTKYRNGDLIGTTTKDINMESAPKYQWSWENDEKNVAKYGRLYTWWAVTYSNLCPVGWHVPTEYEFSSLRNYLEKNGYGSSGKSLASASGWFFGGGSVDDQNENNSSGFTGIPAGWRDGRGYFMQLGQVARWWSESTLDSESIYAAGLDWDRPQLLNCVSEHSDMTELGWGFSVRCIKD